MEDDAYFLAALRYIYQNPVKAGICKRPEDYPWSSYYPGSPYRQMLDTQKVAELVSAEEWPAFLAQNEAFALIDVDTDGRLNDREAAEKIKTLCHLSATTDFCHLNASAQSGYLAQLQQAHCSIRQLARLTGLTKAQIERLLR